MNTTEVLKFLRGAPEEGRYPAGSAGQSFFDLAGLWVEDASYMKNTLDLA